MQILTENENKSKKKVHGQTHNFILGDFTLKLDAQT